MFDKTVDLKGMKFVVDGSVIYWGSFPVMRCGKVCLLEHMTRYMDDEVAHWVFAFWKHYGRDLDRLSARYIAAHMNKQVGGFSLYTDGPIQLMDGYKINMIKGARIDQGSIYGWLYFYEVVKCELPEVKYDYCISEGVVNVYVRGSMVGKVAVAYK